jgi:hypothetical protein
MAIKLSIIKQNPNNPRVIKDDKFQKLVNSIKEFPKMMELRPMVINENNIVLGGNMRLKALKELGYKEVPNEWIKNAKDLTADEQRRFIIADNVGFGEHDWEMLANEWNVEELSEWGLDVPSDWGANEDEENNENNDNDLSDNLETNYRIEVILSDEKTQELLYNELIERNYKCRLLTL